MEREYVGIDFHRRRSVVVRLSPSGERLWRLLLSLPVDKLDRMSLQASLRELGEPQHAIR